MLPLFLLVTSLIVLSPVAHAQVASFNCSKATTPTEHAICASPSLGRKDVTLAAYYTLLLRLSPAVGGMAYREFDDQLHGEQRTWLKSKRDGCNGNVACLDQAYDRRLADVLKTIDGNAALTFGRRCEE
jgi:uncharacterized protein